MSGATEFATHGSLPVEGWNVMSGVRGVKKYQAYIRFDCLDRKMTRSQD